MTITPNLLTTREALEASWDEETSYLGVKKKDNPALGQCYPTSRIVQHFFPETEIIKGKVWNGKQLETHYWNGLKVGEKVYHIDLTWRQYPAGSVVKEYQILDRAILHDSKETIKRYEILLSRVMRYIEGQKAGL